MTRPRVAVLDYGSGNLRSAQRALARAGAEVEVTANTAVALEADGLVVPGVGAYAACMDGLRAVGGDKVIAERIAAGRPVLGICVGMQILFAAGVEHGQRTQGCGCWPGTVDKLTAPILPHMGWNTVEPAPDSVLLAGLGPEPMFYFVHSYAMRSAPHASVTSGPATVEEEKKKSLADAKPPPPRVTWSHHGERFAAIIEDGPLAATQFHPEKSGDTGAALLANWLRELP